LGRTNADRLARQLVLAHWIERAVDGASCVLWGGGLGAWL